MCARFSLTASPEQLAHFFDLVDAPQWSPRFNIAPSQSACVVRMVNGVRRWMTHQWGLLPQWSKDLETDSRFINARSESIFEKVSFRDCIRTQRCLVPVSGFYEWTGPKGAKQPQLFTPRTGHLLAFAGIWAHWKPPEQPTIGQTLDLFGHRPDPIWSFSILTTSANAMVQPIHHRMPVFVNPEHFDQWLDPQQQDPHLIHPLLQPAPADLLTVRTVNPAVNNPRNEGAHLWAQP